MAQTIQLNLHPSYFNEVYIPYLLNEERFTVFYGGGGSGKSHFAVQKMIIKALIYPNRRILVVRKVQNTIRDSIFELFKQILSEMGLLQFCEYTTTYLEINLPNGSQFIFKGLDDPEKIKSITGIDDILIEEATELALDDFAQLNLRLRSQADNQQIVLMFNPVSKTNWVYDYFFVQEQEDTVVTHTTYKDNKFLPDDYVKSLEGYKETNPIYYKVYALGEFATLGKTVFQQATASERNDYSIQEFDVHELVQDNPDLISTVGLDFGFTADPTTVISSLIDESNKIVYVFDEEYEKGLMNDQIAELLLSKGMKREDIFADNAEPKSIEEIKSRGLRHIQGGKKGADSIRSGIQFMKQFHFIVHPSCKNLIQEFMDYNYVKDKATGHYTNDVQGEDHCLDALRYSMQKIQFTNKVTFMAKSVFGL